MEEFLLIEFDGKWYRTAASIWLDSLIIANFSMVLKISGSDVHVLKDRYSGRTGTGGNADLLKVQLFTLGKSFLDLPEFIPCRKQYANTDLVVQTDGTLVEQEVKHE